MTAEEKISPPQTQPANVIPWLVTLGALLLYGMTLKHLVTLASLPLVASVTGWDWHPFPLPWRLEHVHPLFLILTSPVRLLPVAWQPAALNAFAAVCAAASLGFLAASVRLFPHDRTRDQRQREGGAFSLLSTPTAFIPPLFAVVMMALQLTFWRNATAASVDMLDVAVFAALIFCLLKFRISQNDIWLAGFAFLYGLGTTNNWALIGFFPFFLAAVVWIKGITFFNWRFMARLAACGVIGLLPYLLVPAMGSLGSERANFFSLLHMELGAQSYSLRLVPRWIVAVAALPTLLPLIFAGIRWPSFEGELSAAGNMMTKYMFRALHVFFLLLALFMFFDYKRSPNQILQDQPVQFLTFYYMGALCIGYYSGYILLIFGKGAAQGWESRDALSKAFNLLMSAGVCLLAVAAPCALLWQNVPHISAGTSDTLADFSREVLRELPAKPAIILSDEPARSYLLEAEFSREGKVNKNIMIDTASFPHKEYIAYLLSRNPELKKLTRPLDKLPNFLPPAVLATYLYTINTNYPIYYLHPSFGYYFEVFYLKPHGLIYEMQTYPRNVMVPPLLPDQDIIANQEVWARLEKGSLARLPSLAKLDSDVNTTCVNYSLAMNWLGVEVQKAGHLPEANALFAKAMQINPQNFLAKINKQYNERLQKGDHRPIDTGEFIYKAINVYRGMVPILKFNGTVDEPDLDLEFGQMFAEGHNYRQAAILFDRRLQLLPGDAIAELDMTKTFVDWGLPDKAIEWVRKLRANPAVKRWDASRVEALAYYSKNDFPTAEKLMVNALQEDPTDENRVSILAEFYRVTAEAALRQKQQTEASRRFTNALSYINKELQLLEDAHNAPQSHDVLDAMLKKAEVETMLKMFDASITTLSGIIDVQPKNPTAILNRAIAELQVGKLPDAKSDYKKLRKLLPEQPYLSDYGLAEVADREKDKSGQIHYLKRVLDSAPTNSAEYIQVKQRLKKLEGP